MPFILLASFILVVILIWAIVRFYQKRCRRLLFSKPFPEKWKSILQQNSKLYRILPPPLKDKLHGLMHIFLAEKHFEGCQGLFITETMKLIVASQACLLLLNLKPNHQLRLYPTLSTILVYPSAYLVPERLVLGLHQVIETKQARLGESWQRGSVVLAWDAVYRNAQGQTANQNVVLHEFAHQLDQEDGLSDGVPQLSTRSQYQAWAHVLSREYRQLHKALAKNHVTLLREYAATNAAEFFAVVTEVFFTSPHAMKVRHKELYCELQSYYGLDPAAWG